MVVFGSFIGLVRGEIMVTDEEGRFLYVVCRYGFLDPYALALTCWVGAGGLAKNSAGVVFSSSS